MPSCFSSEWDRLFFSRSWTAELYPVRDYENDSSLEEELEFPIFIRNKKGVRLTENGKLMIPYFREIVDVNQVATQVSEEIKGVVRGSITIGCYFSVSSMWMPSLLKTFSETYPLIQITLLEGGNKEIAKWLAEKICRYLSVRWASG